MKLRTISEVTVAEPDQVLGMLGSAAKKIFQKGKKLPDRLPRRKKHEVDYQDASPPGYQKCVDCEYFDKQLGNRHKCKIVEGTILAEGWCKMWDQR